MRTTILAILLFAAAQDAAAQQAFCGPGTADTDCDGVPDVSDGCPNDSFNVVPGPCGCGKLEFDINNDGIEECVDSCNFTYSDPSSICQCPVFKLIEQRINVPIYNCGAGPLLSAATVLKIPPVVVVLSGTGPTKSVNIYLTQFSGVAAALTSSKRTRILSPKILEAIVKQRPGKRSTTLSVQYDVVVDSTSIASIERKRTSKKNIITLSGLNPGEYTAKYRLLAVDKKNKVAFKTKFSPSSSFTIPN
jgi:hypothetical protein